MLEDLLLQSIDTGDYFYKVKKTFKNPLRKEKLNTFLSIYFLDHPTTSTFFVSVVGCYRNNNVLGVI